MADSLKDQLLALGFRPSSRKAGRDDDRRPGSGRSDDGQPPPRGKGRGDEARAAGAAKQAARVSTTVARSAPAPDRTEPDLARAYALRARAERAERERAARAAAEQAKIRRERREQLAALLAGKALNLADADLPRHFPHAGKIRRVYVNAAQLDALNRGELGVVQHRGRYLLVDRATALAAQSLDADALVLLPEPGRDAEDDVPPDLIW